MYVHINLIIIFMMFEIDNKLSVFKYVFIWQVFHVYKQRHRIDNPYASTCTIVLVRIGSC